MALNQREKALLSLPVLLGGLMGFYNWVHEPLFIRKADARGQYEQVRAELQRDEARLKREGDLTARRSTVQAREQTIDSWVPGKNSAAMFIWYLSQSEIHSGGRIRSITLSDRRTVKSEEVAAAQAEKAAGPSGASQQEGKTGGAKNQGQNTAAANSRQAQPANAGQTNDARPQGSAPDLTMIQLELKVDARFAEHLLFNQSMEQMPLFISTNALSLVRAEALPVNQAGEALAEGNALLAGKMLRASPVVTGVYRVNLYFKNQKAGPATASMTFAESAGRSDPFAMTGVDEFIQSVLDFYANPAESMNQDFGSGRYRGPGVVPGQMG